MILSLKLFLLCDKNQASTSIPDFKSSHYEQNIILLYFNTLILDLTIRDAHFHSWLTNLVSKKWTSPWFPRMSSSLYQEETYLSLISTVEFFTIYEKRISSWLPYSTSYILIKSGLLYNFKTGILPSIRKKSFIGGKILPTWLPQLNSSSL